MEAKARLLSLVFRFLRLVGVLLLIYASMVFYLALTERQNAYPRAISHKEAREAISKEAKSISCTLADGVVLEGWNLGSPEAPLALYFPDANEDAAQFLAEVGAVNWANFVSFNYRGNGNNKGTPSQEAFDVDMEQIFQCASQLSGRIPQVLIGRGTGVIWASQQFRKPQTLILLDPVESIADAVSEKYRALYPKFLVRARAKIPMEKLKTLQSSVIVLSDRSSYSSRIPKISASLPQARIVYRNGAPLRQVLFEAMDGAR